MGVAEVMKKKKFGKSQLDSWITMQKSHAIANGTCSPT